MAKSKRKPLSNEEAHVILKALADPRRYEILNRLGVHGKTVACESMRECMGISAATLSHHMKELETAGLIEVFREGKFAKYLLRRDTLKAFLDRVRADLL